MTYFNKQMICILCVLGLFAMPVTARGTAELIADGWTLWDYPSIPTTTVPDTVTSVDYPWAMGGSDIIPDGNGALYIGEQARAWYRFADVPLFGEISFLVYDKGTSYAHASSTYGPRWGVQNNPAPNPVPAGGTPNDQLMSVELIAKSFMPADLTYSFITGNASDVSNSSSHFSPSWPGSHNGASTGQHAYRRVAGATSSNPILGEDFLTYDPANNVQGAWARWTFSVHDGEDMKFMVTDLDGSNEQSWTVVPSLDSVFDTGYSTTGFNQVFFYGGNINGNGTQDHVGLWIDDITFIPDPGQGAVTWSENFVPEPASLSILAMTALAALRRR